MDEELSEEDAPLDIEIVVNGEKLNADDLRTLIYAFESALKEASVIDQDSSIEILSKEASYVLSKSGY
jgi:hypothetical protein